MNLAKSIDASITKNAKSLDLLKEALSLINKKPAANQVKPANKLKFFKEVQHLSKKKGAKAKNLKKLGRLLAGTGFLGLSTVGKKRNAILRGGVLGAAAGALSLWTNYTSSEHEVGVDAPQNGLLPVANSKAMTIILYTIGGLAAGTLINQMNGNKKLKKWAKRNKEYFKKGFKNFNLN